MFYDSIDKSKNETICAIATPAGSGAIAIIRISGPLSFEIGASLFTAKNKKLIFSSVKSHSLHYGIINDKMTIIDDVMLSIFKSPNSYTGEDSLEISCHGSSYIQQRILELIIDNGGRSARPGEFTFRAFMNGKFDLSQAEAVADLIASDSRGSHQLAMDQMRGGYSDKIKMLRKQLVDFASLIELELDFAEEDVEFADRIELLKVVADLDLEIQKLIASFSVGNVMKHGIPVAIIGKPNVGKSTLLNTLLNEDKAIVSEIPGTTRDVIEDTISINGILFRFIDTAGLREAQDEIENLGIKRTREKINQASVILYVFDINSTSVEEIESVITEYKEITNDDYKSLILVANKIDKSDKIPKGFSNFDTETIFISAKHKENIEEVTNSLKKKVNSNKIADSTIISNIRHYEALKKIASSMHNIQVGFNENIPTDLISIDIRQALYFLGEITGEITTDEILANIFGKFCIGK